VTLVGILDSTGRYSKLSLRSKGLRPRYFSLHVRVRSRWHSIAYYRTRWSCGQDRGTSLQWLRLLVLVRHRRIHFSIHLLMLRLMRVALHCSVLILRISRMKASLVGLRMRRTVRRISVLLVPPVPIPILIIVVFIRLHLILHLVHSNFINLTSGLVDLVVSLLLLEFKCLLLLLILLFLQILYPHILQTVQYVFLHAVFIENFFLLFD